MTVYKIKITNTVHTSYLYAVLFGYNKFFNDAFFGSCVGINIEVLKDGKPIPYIQLIQESANKPFKVTKTWIESSVNQGSELFIHYKCHSDSKIITKTPFMAISLDPNTHNGITTEYSIDADTYLMAFLHGESVSEFTLHTND